MSDEQATPSRDALKQARHREGVKATLAEILQEQRETREQLQQLSELLGIELTRTTSPEHRR